MIWTVHDKSLSTNKITLLFLSQFWQGEMFLKRHKSLQGSRSPSAVTVLGCILLPAPPVKPAKGFIIAGWEPRQLKGTLSLQFSPPHVNIFWKLVTTDFSSLLPSVLLTLTDFNETNAGCGFPFSLFPYLTPQELTFCCCLWQNGKLTVTNYW